MGYSINFRTDLKSDSWSRIVSYIIFFTPLLSKLEHKVCRLHMSNSAFIVNSCLENIDEIFLLFFFLSSFCYLQEREDNGAARDVTMEFINSKL